MANLITSWLNPDNFTQLRDKFNAIKTVLSGGATGQYLTKSGNGDGEFVWSSRSIVRSTENNMLINENDILKIDISLINTVYSVLNKKVDFAIKLQCQILDPSIIAGNQIKLTFLLNSPLQSLSIPFTGSEEIIGYGIIRKNETLIADEYKINGLCYARIQYDGGSGEIARIDIFIKGIEGYVLEDDSDFFVTLKGSYFI